MASLASPTWAEVLAMDETTRAAFNIVKGEQNGDEYLWDAEWYEKDGSLQVGGWKSVIEKKGRA
jgi:hypothetical protein